VTANRNRKHRVRARARAAGESYTAALWRDRRGATRERALTPLRRIERPAFGFALSVPEEWEEASPNLRNSPWEVARFAAAGGDGPACIVVRYPARPGLDARTAALAAQALLRAAGFRRFRLADVTVAGHRAARLEYEQPEGGGPSSIKHVFVVAGTATLGVRLATTAPERDAKLLDTIAATLELVGASAAAGAATAFPHSSPSTRASGPSPDDASAAGAAGPLAPSRVFEHPAWGFSVCLPVDWIEQPPQRDANPWEVARFAVAGDARRACVISRRPQPGRTAREVADEVCASLVAIGFGDVTRTESVLSGESAVRVSCALRDAGRVWAVHNYHAVVRGVGFTLHFGTAVPEEDCWLLDAIVGGFCLLPPRDAAPTKR